MDMLNEAVIEQGAVDQGSVTDELHIPQRTIVGQETLTFTLVAGTEGIGTTYSCKPTYQVLADNFEIEDEALPEFERLQRDADRPRVKKILAYLRDRDNTVFPSACLVLSAQDFELKRVDVVVDGEVVDHVWRGTLPAWADRLFIDGQGRLVSIKEVLQIRPELASHALDVKIVLVPTKTIRESEAFVRQIFADFHLGLRKPNKSQSLFFDSETAVSRFVNNELPQAVDALDGAMVQGLSRTGRLAKGQLFNLATVHDMVRILLGGVNETKANEMLDNPVIGQHLKQFMINFFASLYKHLPLKDLQDHPGKPKEMRAAANNNVLTCVIGFKALAYLGCSMSEEFMYSDAEEPEQMKAHLDDLLGRLAKLKEMPLTERGDKTWTTAKIYQNDDGKITIVKGSEKRLAFQFCRKVGVMPCEALGMG